MSNPQYDIVIIGGGISGLGIARLASFYGFNVCLLEKGKIGHATSNNSLRIIHGGFRYLQTLNFPRVIESIRAQSDLIQSYPDIIKPLPCLMPLKRFGLKSWTPVNIARMLFILISTFTKGRLPSPKTISAKEVGELAPVFTSLTKQGALLWYDGLLTDTATLFSRLHREAEKHGARLIENALVESVEDRGELCEIGYNCNGERKIATSGVVFNSSGPWLNTIGDSFATGLEWCRAFNLVLNRQLEPKFGLSIPTKSRLLFCVPRDGGSAIGTWYLPFQSSELENLKLSDSEISNALSEINAAWPGVNIKTHDIANIEIGALPTRSSKSEELNLYGREQFIVRGRIVHILSTKFTTFNEQAKRALFVTGRYLRSVAR